MNEIVNPEELNERKKRLSEFIKFLGIDNERFEIFSELPQGFVMNFNGKLKIVQLRNIEIAYPEFNIQWLYTGKGSMFHNDDAMRNNTEKVINELVELKNNVTGSE